MSWFGKDKAGQNVSNPGTKQAPAGSAVTVNGKPGVMLGGGVAKADDKKKK